MEEDAENIGLFSLDPSLEAYGDHFKYRIRRFTNQKNLIEKHEGNLEEFAQGNMMKSRLHNFYVPELLKVSVSLLLSRLPWNCYFTLLVPLVVHNDN